MAENSRVRDVRAIECVESVELEFVTKTTPSTVLPLMQRRMNLTIVSAVAENPRLRNVRAIECVETVELELVTKTTPSTVLPLLQSRMNLTIVSAVAENPLVTRILPSKTCLKSSGRGSLKY